MIKVYYANVNDLEEDKVFEEKLQMVQASRQHKVLRCKQRQDQLRSLGAGLLIRYGLEQEMLAYDSLVFEENSHGKILVNCDLFPIWINVSHSGDFAAVAVSNHKIGIDIQQQRDMKSEEKMKRLCYNEKEMNSKENFFYHWTRKEAYSKMMGLGMQMEFQSIETLDNPKLWSKRIEGDYWLSVASSHDIKEVEVNRICLTN